MCLEPIKISRIPDGALQQAAMKQSQFSKDRKDIRDLQTRAKKNEGEPKSGLALAAKMKVRENK